MIRRLAMKKVHLVKGLSSGRLLELNSKFQH